jgi:hypothetical protein
LQPGKESADQIQADAGTFGLQISDTKCADLAFNGGNHGLGLFTTNKWLTTGSAL